MSSPSKAERIALTHYNACNGCYQVDNKTLPPFVNHKEFRGGAITELEWKEFCHLVTINLQPINRLRSILKGVLACIMITLLALFIFLFDGYDLPTQEYFRAHPDYWLIPTLAGVLIVIGVAVSCYAAVMTKKAFIKIQHLCEEQSKVLATTARSSSSLLLVSFHLCDERSEKGFHVQPNDKFYTGDDFYHHPFRTYHNVYILAVVTIIDPESGFAPSIANPLDFYLPVKFPTIEFHSSTDNDDGSTLGEDTIYTSFGADMTVTEDILKYEQKKKQTKKAHTGSSKKKTKKEIEEKEVATKKVSKKVNKKKATKADDKPKSKKTTKQTKTEKKGKEEGTTSPNRLDTISEAS